MPLLGGLGIAAGTALAGYLANRGSKGSSLPASQPFDFEGYMKQLEPYREQQRGLLGRQSEFAKTRARKDIVGTRQQGLRNLLERGVNRSGISQQLHGEIDDELLEQLEQIEASRLQGLLGINQMGLQQGLGMQQQSMQFQQQLPFYQALANQQRRQSRLQSIFGMGGQLGAAYMGRPDYSSLTALLQPQGDK